MMALSLRARSGALRVTELTKQPTSGSHDASASTVGH